MEDLWECTDWNLVRLAAINHLSLRNLQRFVDISKLYGFTWPTWFETFHRQGSATEGIRSNWEGIREWRPSKLEGGYEFEYHRWCEWIIRNKMVEEEEVVGETYLLICFLLNCTQCESGGLDWLTNSQTVIQLENKKWEGKLGESCFADVIFLVRFQSW